MPVVPISTCPVPGPLHTVLGGYKDALAVDARRHFASILRTLLEGFLALHLACLESLAGGELLVRAVVPPTRRQGPPPSAPSAPSGYTRACSSAGKERSGTRGASPTGFLVPTSARAQLRGRRVLLLDDVYTTGARAQSAACTLVRSGAAAVVIVVAGRVLRPTASVRAAAYWRRVVDRPYRLDRCCAPTCLAR